MSERGTEIEECEREGERGTERERFFYVSDSGIISI